MPISDFSDKSILTPPSGTRDLTLLRRLKNRDITLDFNELSPLKRRLYLLQKGVPVSCNKLPASWPDVIRDLFKSGEITLEELKSEESIEVIKQLYEQIRLKVAAFWTAEPEPYNNRDWTLYYMEDFDVFDRAIGSKYWKHYRNSLVRPTSTRTDHNELRQVAETDNEDESHHDTDGSTVTEDKFTIDENRATYRAEVVMPSRCNGKEPIFVGEDDVLEDMYEDGEYNQTNPDSVLVESMRDQFPSPHSVMGSQELGELLSFSEEYLAEDPSIAADVIHEYPDKSPVGTIWHEINQQQHYHDINPNSVSPVEHIGCLSPGILEAFNSKEISKKASADRGIRTIDEAREDATNPTAKKRKARAQAAIVVHEDSPGWTPGAQRTKASNVRSPGTDIQKENQTNLDHSSSTGSRRDHESRHLMSTPRARRTQHFEPIFTSPLRRYLPGVHGAPVSPL